MSEQRKNKAANTGYPRNKHEYRDRYSGVLFIEFSPTGTMAPGHGVPTPARLKDSDPIGLKVAVVRDFRLTTDTT